MTSPKHADMELRTLRYLPGGWAQGARAREVATAAFRTTRTAGQTLPATAPKHAGMALRTRRVRVLVRT